MALYWAHVSGWASYDEAVHHLLGPFASKTEAEAEASRCDQTLDLRDQTVIGWCKQFQLRERLFGELAIDPRDYYTDPRGIWRSRD
jgi:hypothetical protein